MSSAPKPANFQVADSARLFLNRAGVRRHIAGSKPCFSADLGFNETRVEARAGDVMAGAGGVAGPAPDVRHQRAGLIIVIYNNFCIKNKHATCGINAVGTVVNTACYYEQDRGFESLNTSFFFPVKYVYIHACTCTYNVCIRHLPVQESINMYMP